MNGATLHNLPNNSIQIICAAVEMTCAAVRVRDEQTNI